MQSLVHSVAMGGVITDSFHLNLTVMRAFGFFGPDESRLSYRFFACVLYVVLLLPVPLLGCLNLVLNDVDLVRVSENAFLLAEMGCYIVKFSPFLTNSKKIKECILYFDGFVGVDCSQKKIIEKCTAICRRNTKIFLFSVTGGVISWAIQPLFWKDYRLPVDLWLPLDPTAALSVYYPIYAYVVIQVLYAAYSSGVVDPLIAGLACQASGQFQVLKHNLRQLSQSPDVYHEIRKCIQHHDAIIKFVKTYEECFSLAVFSQFVGSVIVICVSCLQLTMMEPLSFNFFSMTMYLITMLLEIYLFCYYGTTLTDDSATIIESIYMGEWYDLDKNSKKALLVLMERSKEPVVVTAGRILDLSLQTFMTILRRSYSLLAVLQNYR